VAEWRLIDDVSQHIMGMLLVRMLERLKVRADQLLDEGMPAGEVEEWFNGKVYMIAKVGKAFEVDIHVAHRGEPT
jgi:hypothetical protein